MSRHSSEQAALPYPADDSRYDDLTGCRQGQADVAGRGGTLETKPCTSLCVGKGHAPATGAGGNQRCHNGERNRSNPPTSKDLSDEAGRRLRLLVCRMANDAAADGMNLLQHGAVRPQTRPNYAASLLKFESWLEQREEKVVTDAEIDAAMCSWMENEFTKGNQALRRKVAQCLDGQVHIVRQTRCPQIAKDLEKPPGLAAPLTWTLKETSGACSMVRDRVQTGGARPAFHGTVGDDGAPCLCPARRAPAYATGDLVPPLRGALQNF